MSNAFEHLEMALATLTIKAQPPSLFNMFYAVPPTELALFLELSRACAGVLRS